MPGHKELSAQSESKPEWYRRNMLVQPPAFLLLCVGLMFVLDASLPLAALVHFPWTLSGLTLIGAGVAIALAVEIELAKHRTTIWPFERPSTLITNGAFAYSRNPMYIGQVIALGGVAVLFGTVIPWVVVFFYSVVLDRVYVRSEEATLRATFGEAYDQYCKRVPRWL